MSRYKVHGEWFPTRTHGDKYAVWVADAIDMNTLAVFAEGAWCVTHVKPGTKGSRGKPFFGESAWSDAQRLAYDLEIADRFSH